MSEIVWFGIKGGGSEGRTLDGRLYRITSHKLAPRVTEFRAFSVDTENRMTALPLPASSMLGVLQAKVIDHAFPPAPDKEVPVTTKVKDRPLTVEEIALYRDVLRWCRANNVFFQQHNGRWMEPTEYETMRGPVVGRSVEIWNHHGTWELGIDDHGGSRTPDVTWHKAVSLTKSIDLLVHLEMLPPRFHSAYRAGWHACKVWEQHPGTAPRGWEDEFKRLFHDPANISFPAGTETR